MVYCGCYRLNCCLIILEEKEVVMRLKRVREEGSYGEEVVTEGEEILNERTKEE